MKIIRSLALIALCIACTSPAAQQPEPDKNVMIEGIQAQQTLAAVIPVLNTFVSDLQTGDIDALEKHLQEQVSALKSASVIQFIQDYGPALQGFLEQAITEMPIDKFPVDWQKDMRGAQQLALLELPSLAIVIKSLSDLQPYIDELPSSIRALSSALRSIKTTPQFEALKQDVTALYTTTLSPALVTMSSLQFKKIKIALDELAKKQANKPFKNDHIIAGFDEVRIMFPLLINALAQLAALADKIATATSIATSRNPLPEPVKADIDTINEQSATFLKSMRFLEHESNKALGK